ncbi:Golgi-specific brefeldin A-resistance guanine nucleotide exchange factor 1-like isoform X2 [Stegodyphus dumicola]|uniref:Golgi-specific brefeldin A-resistance guanine nucleotide exchange factor 1-like isoform X2 n=1 Tax=Stegodyphus dumicola TaxID=202533 RepID=UPI0015A9497F|nr:Golgi-specific brefeldin A-resistance guanine nucleotide exchange factor 1-like isoform X2 [Stegodyphus dumicola]
MPCPDNSIYIVVGEMNMVMTSMKKANRWSAHIHQEEEQDSLLKSFSDLKEMLNQVNSLNDIEPITYLKPFLDVIRAETTTGPVTGLGLSAVSKFLSYGLIDAKHATAPLAAENIADAVTHARFMGTDSASDEVVLMKILHVLRLLLLTPLGVLLTNESVCEIMQSCFRFCFETRLSELLRRSAEHALMDMVQLLFSCLPQFNEDSRCAYMKKLKMRSGGLDTGRSRRKRSPRLKHRSIHSSEPTESNAPNKSTNSLPSSLSNSSEVTLENTSRAPDASPNSPESVESCQEAVLYGNPAAASQNNINDSGEINTDCDSINYEKTEISESGIDNQNPELILKIENVKGQNYQESMESGPAQSYPVNVGCEASDNVNGILPNSSLEAETNNQNKLNESVEVSSESGSLNTDALEESSLADHSELDYVNPRGVRFTPHQQPKEGSGPLVPYGLPCVRELFRYLVSLVNPHDRHNSETMIQVGLNLLTVALEAGADNLGRFASFLSLIRDETCRNLFALMQIERLTVFAAALRVSFLLFEALRTHLKFQLEMFLKTLMEMIVSETVRISYEQREISLDCIAQLWRIPGLVTELYINYDCDLYCSNLFEELTKMLSKNAYPLSGLYSVHLLSLEALLAVIENIENHCQCRMLNQSQFLQDSIVSSAISENGNVDLSKRGVLQQGASGYLLGQELISNHGEEKPYPIVNDYEKQKPFILPNRMKISVEIPSHEMLMAVKHKKKILITGTEQFNSQPSKGISFLQEHGLLKDTLDPQEVAIFLRDNPQLDKKMIGEYISNRKNLKVLEAFVRSFAFEGTRIDEALRQYLETFRLPGEAPLISLIMEHFAEHWHNSNNQPFANNDAAFTLAYAIIMLNVDQHNHNVKKQNIPMTIDDFKKNLKGVNGGNDFDENLLEEIYASIKNEEIVMPAEQTGIVRENYLWKVLLRRGSSKEGKFIHTPNGLFDHDLFSLVWGPTVAALSFIFDKSSEPVIIEKTINGFRKCAMIAAHYGMSDVFDNLIISLCKFSTLTNTTETPKTLSLSFGNNSKAQVATKAMFRLAHHHGDILREGWKNILDCVLQLYKSSLLPKELLEAEDFVNPKGVISLVREDVPVMPRAESGLFSSFYMYITSDSPQKQPTQEDEAAKQAALKCIAECHCEQLFTESKFLRVDSLQELVKTLIFVCHAPESPSSIGGSYDEDSTVFLMELLIKIVLLNRDRVMSIWRIIRDHLLNLIMASAASDHKYLLERAVVGILRIAIRLIRKEEMIPQVLQSLRVLLYLKPTAMLQVSKQIAYALHELLRTNAANIHSQSDWALIFSLLERVGAGAKPPREFNSVSVSPTEVPSKVVPSGAQSDSELSIGRHSVDSGLGLERGYTSDTGVYENQPESPRSHNHQLNLLLNDNVNQNGEIENVQPLPVNQYNIVLHRELLQHDPIAFLKCCESLAFLVRDAAHITTENFESCVHCIRTFVEASTHGGYSHDRKSKLKVHKEKKMVKSIPKRKEERIRVSHYQSNRQGEGYEADDEEKADEFASAYQQVSLQLLDLMHTLHTRAASICNPPEGSDDNNGSKSKPNLWSDCWCPLLQGIARLCCDPRRALRTSALTLLPRALLVHDLQTLTPLEWESCFNKVLFPLLAKLLENISPTDPLGMEETRMRGATLLCKVFLQHLSPLLTLPTFMALWLTILEFMDKYMHADGSDLLAEAIPESLKNMLLVMDTAGVFECPEDGNNSEKCQMWHITWDRINAFLPDLKDELFKQSVPKTAEPVEQVPESHVDSQEDVPKYQTDVNCDKIQETALISPTSSPVYFPPASSHDDANLMTPPVSVILHPPTAPIVYSNTPINNCSAVTVSNVSQPLPSPVALPLLLDPVVMTQTNMPIFTSHQAPQRDGSHSLR